MKIRKSIKYIAACFSIILILFSCVNILNVITKTSTINSNKEIYKYTNKFNYDYTVNLVKNEFIPDKSLGMTEDAYITDLIDNIKVKFNYTYEASNETPIDYEYEIVGVLSAVYAKDGINHKIWEQEDVLKKLVKDSKITNSVDVNEKITLDLKKYNELVRDFQDQMGMSVTANYTVMLKVKTNTSVDQTEVENEYVPAITIDLAQKITTISGENNLEKTEYISKQASQKENISVIKLAINIVLLLVAIVLLKAILKSKTMNIVRNEYRQELNRILRLCQDKIVEVSQNPNEGKENVIDVADFGEIIKVSEELFKPILYWYSEETEEAQFTVISDNVVYRYILRK